MKITPLEIRQKDFEKVFRGYDKDSVDAFLQSLSQEWERNIDEMKELKMKLETSEREVAKLREVESSLFKTLKTAEDTGSNMIQQANKTAELHLKETQMKSEALMNDAKFRAKSIIEEAEVMSRQLLDEMEGEAKELVEVCRRLESHRDTIISELRNLSNDTLSKAQKVEERAEKSRIELTLNKLKSMQKEYTERTQPVKDDKRYQTPEMPSMPAANTPKKQESSNSKSFFDEIG